MQKSSPSIPDPGFVLYTWTERDAVPSKLESSLKSRSDSLNGSQTASLFIRGHREGVAYPRHLGCGDVSVLFVVPLWETTPAAERGRETRRQSAADSSIDSSSNSQSAITHLQSTLEMCVSLVLPPPQGSM